MLPTGDVRPLAGLRVVVTRAEIQSQELNEQLRVAGATVLLLPAIQFAGPEDCAPLDAAISELDKFDWVIFTSVNAVRYFVRRCRETSVDISALKSGRGSTKVAVVGSATSKSAGIEGIKIELMGKEYRGEVLAEELASQIHGKRVLLPRSNRATGELPAALRAAGAEVTDVIAYRTIDVTSDSDSPEAFEAVREGTADVICFFSPSAFYATETRFGREPLRRAALAAIGPVTGRAIRGAGLKVAVESRAATTEEFVSALSEHFSSTGSRGVSTT